MQVGKKESYRLGMEIGISYKTIQRCKVVFV
jgi:hypothetical protein